MPLFFKLKGLKDLPGLHDVEAFENPEHALKLLEKFPVLTCAGNKGCINLWKLPTGLFRASLGRFRAEVTAFGPGTREELSSWLGEYYPTIDCQPSDQ